MTDSRLRFAVIGCGALARMQHIPNLLASSSACLHLCCDQSPEVLQFCRDHYGVAVCDDWRAAVMDPGVEAVCLATTEKLRYPVIALAAECGKPVYVEKPLGLTLAEILKIQQVVHESRIPFCVMWLSADHRLSPTKTHQIQQSERVAVAIHEDFAELMKTHIAEIDV